MNSFIIRGIPNFAHVQIVQAESVQELLSSTICKVFGYRVELWQQIKADKQQKIMLYILCTQDNTDVVQKWCNDGRGGCVLTLNAEGIKTAGTWSGLPRVGEWYMVQPMMHPQYEQVRKAEQARQKLLQQQAAIEAEKEEAKQAEFILWCLSMVGLRL